MNRETHPNYAQLDARFRNDAYSKLLGAEVLDWAGGSATIRWIPGRDHTNFTGDVHGGAIFSLADIAFSIACNGWGRVAVALTVEIHYLAAPPLGRALVATATERSRGRRTGSYLIEVRQEGEPDQLVASFQSMAYRSSRWHLGEERWPDEWRARY